MGFRRLTELHWNMPKQGIFNLLLTLSIALAINVILFLIPPPVSVTSALYNFHLETALLLILFFSLIFSRTGIVWDTISLTMTLILFNISLIYKWQTARY